MRMKRTVGLLFGAVLACFAGAGCGGEPSSDPEAAEHVGTYRAVGEGGDAALLEGTVRLIDGCFVVEQDPGGRYLPFFPEDEVTWSDAGLRYGGNTYGEGDVIALGGGASGTLAPMPERCGAVANMTRWTVTQDD